MSGAPALYSPAKLAPELRAEVDRLLAGPVRLPPLHEDDAGMLLPLDPPLYDPRAQQAADALRVALGQPADTQVIRQWLNALMMGNSNAPRSPDDFSRWASALLVTCGDEIPLAGWDIVTLRQALRTFKQYWPNVGEVFELLIARVKRLERELKALDDIATSGVRTRPGPAREAFGYDPGPAAPERSPHPSMPNKDSDPAADLVRIDPAEVGRQLAALGLDKPGEDLLAARRAVPVMPAPEKGHVRISGAIKAALEAAVRARSEPAK